MIASSVPHVDHSHLTPREHAEILLLNLFSGILKHLPITRNICKLLSVHVVSGSYFVPDAYIYNFSLSHFATNKGAY